MTYDPTSEPERIVLEPECCASPEAGRMWARADQNPWPNIGDCDHPGVEYVRADLVNKGKASSHVWNSTAAMILAVTRAVREGSASPGCRYDHIAGLCSTQGAPCRCLTIAVSVLHVLAHGPME